MTKPLRSPIAVLPELNTVGVDGFVLSDGGLDVHCPATGLLPSSTYAAKTSEPHSAKLVTAIGTARSLSIRIPIVFQNA